jgi:hypothetical protein
MHLDQVDVRGFQRNAFGQDRRALVGHGLGQAGGDVFHGQG